MILFREQYSKHSREMRPNLYSMSCTYRVRCQLSCTTAHDRSLRDLPCLLSAITRRSSASSASSVGSSTAKSGGTAPLRANLLMVLWKPRGCCRCCRCVPLLLPPPLLLLLLLH